MAVRAKQAKVFSCMIAMVAIQVMNMENKFLTIPLGNSTFFTFRIIAHESTDILFLQIVCLHFSPKFEDFRVISICKLACIMKAIVQMGIMIIEMRHINSIFLDFILQCPVIMAHFRHAQQFQTIEPAVRF